MDKVLFNDDISSIDFSYQLHLSQAALYFYNTFPYWHKICIPHLEGTYMSNLFPVLTRSLSENRDLSEGSPF